MSDRSPDDPQSVVKPSDLSHQSPIDNRPQDAKRPVDVSPRDQAEALPPPVKLPENAAAAPIASANPDDLPPPLMPPEKAAEAAIGKLLANIDDLPPTLIPPEKAAEADIAKPLANIDDLPPTYILPEKAAEAAVAKPLANIDDLPPTLIPHDNAEGIPQVVKLPTSVSEPPKIIVCSNCGHRNRPGIAACENCGKSLLGKGAVDTRQFEGQQPLQAPNDTGEMMRFAVKSTTTGNTFTDDMVLRLEIEGAATPILLFPKLETVIGRRDPATGTMPDVDMTSYAGYRMGVSRRHAIIRLQNNAIEIYDLGSSNGTAINGTKLSPHAALPLHDGDEITLGKMTVKVLFQLRSRKRSPS